MRKREKLIAIALALLASVALAAFAYDITDDERAKEQARIEKLAAELLPKVAEATGFEPDGPVKIVVTTKDEVREFLIKLLEEEYPGDELERMSRCYAVLGLLPAGFDLRAGLVDLYQEQAGAFYDPRTKAFYSIIDLPKEMKIPAVEKVIVAHELTHALQDRVVDLLTLQRAGDEDTDRGYAVTATMEGMASVSMMVAGYGMALNSLPKLGGMMRMSMAAAGSNPLMKTFAASPKYLQETLISPYAEGADFVQAFLKAHPDEKLAALLAKLPESSEQILHYEKYAEGDSPTSIDISGVDCMLPGGWKPYYENTLGEFDVRILCEINKMTKEEAAGIAAGWDGIRFKAFIDDQGELLLLGASVWDSEADANEFAAGLSKLLSGFHDPELTAVECSGNRVQFIIGEPEGAVRRSLLDALATAPVAEEAR